MLKVYLTFRIGLIVCGFFYFWSLSSSDLLFIDSFTVPVLELDLFPFTLSVGEPTWPLSSERFPFSSHSRGTNAIGAGNCDSPRAPLDPQSSAHNVITQQSVVLNTHSIAQNAPMPFPGEVFFAAAVTDNVIPAAIGISAKTAIPTTRQKQTHISLGSPMQYIQSSADMMYPMYRKTLTLCNVAIPISTPGWLVDSDWNASA